MSLFRRREARSDDGDVSATDVAIAAMESRVTGAQPRPDTLAAVETAAGLIGRAFAAARPTGPGAGLLPAFLRELIGRALILRGECVLVPGAGLTLLPASGWDVRGGPDPEGWVYRVDLSGPGGVVSQTRQNDQIIHIRVNPDAATPWRGRSAFASASATASTAAAAEVTAATEARIAVSRLVPIASPLTPEQRGQATQGFADMLKRGGYFAISLMGFRPGMGERMSRASVEAVHPDPTEGHLTLRREAALDLLSAAGIPSPLADPRADAAGQREALRRLVHGTVEPLARAVEGEIAAKVGVEVGFDFGPLFAADLAGRGRALKQMVDSGVALDTALEIVGLGGPDGASN